MSNESDLAYLRDIAESGQRAPMLGGRFFLSWGGLAAVALTLQWAILSDTLPVAHSVIGLIWLSYGVIGGMISMILSRGLRGKPGSGAVSNQGEKAAWTGTTGLIFSWAIGVIAANATGYGHVILFDTIPLVAFAGYGIAFWVSHAMGGPGWLKPMAALSWLAAAGGLFLTGTAELYLFCAACVIVLAVLPGLILVKQEPAAER
jgi:hypothetical protein